MLKRYSRIKRKRPKLNRPSLKFEIVDRAVRRYPDGREVCLDTPAGRAEYYRRTAIMAQRQNWRCGACPVKMDLATVTFDHVIPRGMGGASRDDRIEVDGEWKNRAVHSWCNAKRGSRRL